MTATGQGARDAKLGRFVPRPQNPLFNSFEHRCGWSPQRRPAPPARQTPACPPQQPHPTHHRTPGRRRPRHAPLPRGARHETASGLREGMENRAAPPPPRAANVAGPEAARGRLPGAAAPPPPHPEGRCPAPPERNLTIVALQGQRPTPPPQGLRNRQAANQDSAIAPREKGREPLADRGTRRKSRGGAARNRRLAHTRLYRLLGAEPTTAGTAPATVWRDKL